MRDTLLDIITAVMVAITLCVCALAYFDVLVP